MPTLEPYKGVVYFWKYIPSLPAAIVFASVFFVITAAHAWKMARTKMWFCTPFVIGGSFEVIGYISRTAAYNATGSIVPYLFQSIFLLLAPVFFAASLYMVYSRVVRAVHGEHLSLIRPRWTTFLFVFLDFSFLSVQSNGAGLLAKTKTAQIGSDIIVTGLILQVLAFIGFMVCCGVFHRRFLVRERGGGHHSQQADVERPAPLPVDHPLPSATVPWQACLYMLYATSVAILVRNLFRVVEFAQGTDGYLQAHEWPVYAFDGGLMLPVMVVFYVWHPSTLHVDAPCTRESMIELTGAETAFRPEGGDHATNFKLRSWFWPAQAWHLMQKARNGR